MLPGEMKDVPDSQIIAKIGTEAVLRSDIKAMAYTIVQAKKLDIPPDQLQAFFDMAERPLLKQLIEMKLVYNDAIHSIPAEGMKKITGNINDQFDKEQLPKLMTAAGVSTRQELEAKLRERGNSIEWERRLFFEKNIHVGWLQQKIKQDQEIPASDILGYYTQHLADYEFPGQAKWEELMVSFSRVPDKQTAKAMLADMGNAVMRGAAFAEVAKARSDGITAGDGGLYTSTTQGSLTSKELDTQIFQLPLNRLSRIIETDRGVHIIRVLERKDAGRKTFEEVQTEIRKKLKEQSFEKQLKAYLDELKQKTPVWTVYDDKPGGLEGQPSQ
jgi:parvulin-like peptidyl-prolyl isomerase